MVCATLAVMPGKPVAATAAAAERAASGPVASGQRMDETQATWRAASRLGYWPSTTIVQAMRAHPQGPRGWALDEIDRAFEASRQPARVPVQLAALQQPLPVVFAEFRQEREARLKVQQARVSAADATAGLPAVAGMTPVMASAAITPSPPNMAPAAALAPPPPPNPAPLATARAQQAAAWRLASCSDPSVENPLLARLTEFWFNHLNVFAGRLTVRPFAGHYALNAIRPNVLGRFDTLLLASARHPAMLFYLDQNQNVADGTPGPAGRIRGINENYARELMELHTLGVDAGYTQRDVRELARVLTGWTVDPGSDSGFRFVARLHDKGEKTVLGRAFGAAAQAGEQDGLDAIAMLAAHPATARRIAHRLATFFVADEPPAALVDRLAAEFVAAGGDLRRVMRALVASAEFWDPASTLYKTPYDFACSALAATAGAAADAAAARARTMLTLGFLAAAGQPVHGWPTPDGYRTDAATWLAPEALTRRADLAAALARGAGDPAALLTFFGSATRERIERVAPASRAALAIASPDFMRK